MTPKLFFMGCAALSAASLVIIAIAAVSARFLAARGVDHLSVLPAMARTMERKLDAVAHDVEEAKGHASAAAIRSGSMLGIVTKAGEIQKAGRGSRPGADDSGGHRSVAALTDVEPPTARGGVEGKAVVG